MVETCKCISVLCTSLGEVSTDDKIDCALESASELELISPIVSSSTASTKCSLSEFSSSSSPSPSSSCSSTCSSFPLLNFPYCGVIGNDVSTPFPFCFMAIELARSENRFRGWCCTPVLFPKFVPSILAFRIK